MCFALFPAAKWIASIRTIKIFNYFVCLGASTYFSTELTCYNHCTFQHPVYSEHQRLNEHSRLLPSRRCSVQKCWAACRWPREGSPLPWWFGSSPRRSSSPGLWWRASPPVLCPFYTQISPENSSTNPHRSSAVLWCSLCLWSCQSSSKPTAGIWRCTFITARLHTFENHNLVLMLRCVSYSCLSNNEGCFGPQGGKDACHLHCNISCTHNHTAPVGKTFST